MIKAAAALCPKHCSEGLTWTEATHVTSHQLARTETTFKKPHAHIPATSLNMKMYCLSLPREKQSEVPSLRVCILAYIVCRITILWIVDQFVTFLSPEHSLNWCQSVYSALMPTNMRHFLPRRKTSHNGALSRSNRRNPALNPRHPIRIIKPHANHKLPSE